MGLADIVRSAVGLGQRITADLQTTIKHDPWIGYDASTDPLYAAQVEYPAVVEMGPKPFRTVQGEVIIARAVINIIRPIEPVGNIDGRIEPLDARDQITLPGGLVGAPIMGGGGVVDPSTGFAYAYRIAIG